MEYSLPAPFLRMVNPRPKKFLTMDYSLHWHGFKNGKFTEG